MLQPITLILSIGLSLTIGFALIIALISRPERGWMYYVIFLGLLPFFWEMASPLLRSGGPTHPYERAFLPIVVLTIFIFIIWLCNKIAAQEEVRFQGGPLFYPFLFFIAANILSLINAEEVHSGLIIIFAWIYIFFVYLVIYNTINEFSLIENYTKLFIGVCVILSIYGLYLWLSGMSAKGANPFGRIGILESNHFAFILEETIFLSMFLAMFPYQSFVSRISYLISFILLFFTLLFTYSRGAWVSCMVVLFWLIFISIRKGRYYLRFAGYAFIILFIASMMFYNHPNLRARVLTLAQGPELASLKRYHRFEGSLRVFLEHPILGVGVNNLTTMQTYYEHAPAGSGNLYLRVLAETGIIGFMSFAFLIIKIFHELSKGVKSRLPNSKEEFIQLGFLAGFLANAFDFLFFGLIYPLPWIFFGIGIASTKCFSDRKDHFTK